VHFVQQGQSHAVLSASIGIACCRNADEALALAGEKGQGDRGSDRCGEIFDLLGETAVEDAFDGWEEHGGQHAFGCEIHRNRDITGVSGLGEDRRDVADDFRGFHVENESGRCRCFDGRRCSAIDLAPHIGVPFERFEHPIVRVLRIRDR